MRREQGTTVAEVLVVLLVLGTLFNLWLPNYVGMKKKAQAATIVGDFLAIRDSATMFYSEHGKWPAANTWGSPPDGLEPYLPHGFLWDLRPAMDARYSWDAIALEPTSESVSPAVLGVSVSSRDNALLRAVATVYRGRLLVADGFGGTRRVIFIVGSKGDVFD
jgi:type II secretory pathway pseudopilin PulG